APTAFPGSPRSWAPLPPRPSPPPSRRARTAPTRGGTWRPRCGALFKGTPPSPAARPRPFPAAASAAAAAARAAAARPATAAAAAAAAAAATPAQGRGATLWRAARSRHPHGFPACRSNSTGG
ncbi:hypothetical protein MNEG_7272, partial [Monoraphidium neglectum]